MDEESRLFREAVGPVRRLRDDRVPARRSPPPPEARSRRAAEREVIEALGRAVPDADVLSGCEPVWYARSGVQERVLRKLRRGQLAVQAELDLHGMTVPVAREALARFLDRSRAAGLRCVRVIPGKGLRSGSRGPVLRAAVSRWLQRRGDVLAFCSARPADGGSGALYVLLSRR